MNTSIIVQNLKCHGCANTIVTQLTKIDGILNVDVAPELDKVSFDYDNEERLAIAKTRLSELGYPSEGDINTISKKAKSFVSCAVGRIKS